VKAWKKKYQILSWVTPLVVVLDQLTKWEVVKNFSLGQTRSIVPGIFDLTYVRNTGAAFGILAHADARWRIPFFVLVPLVALVAIFQVFRRIGEKDLKLAYALALVMGGAVGNLIDRAWLNYVVDFLLFHWKYEWQFPAFNIADSAICVGVGILMLDLFHAPDTV
jgi:signal peptidase II